MNKLLIAAGDGWMDREMDGMDEWLYVQCCNPYLSRGIRV